MDDSVDFNLKKELLQKQACFTQLTPEENTKLAELLVVTPFPAGETIVNEGDKVDSVYLIVKGSVDVQIAIINNGALESKSVATLKAGEAIGLNERGFYSLTGKRTATVVAKEDVILLRLNIAEFHGFALAYSHVSEVMRRNAETYTEPKS